MFPTRFHLSQQPGTPDYVEEQLKKVWSTDSSNVTTCFESMATANNQRASNLISEGFKFRFSEERPDRSNTVYVSDKSMLQLVKAKFRQARIQYGIKLLTQTNSQTSKDVIKAYGASQLEPLLLKAANYQSSNKQEILILVPFFDPKSEGKHKVGLALDNLSKKENTPLKTLDSIGAELKNETAKKLAHDFLVGSMNLKSRPLPELVPSTDARDRDLGPFYKSCIKNLAHDVLLNADLSVATRYDIFINGLDIRPEIKRHMVSYYNFFDFSYKNFFRWLSLNVSREYELSIVASCKAHSQAPKEVGRQKVRSNLALTECSINKMLTGDSPPQQWPTIENVYPQ